MVFLLFFYFALIVRCPRKGGFGCMYIAPLPPIISVKLCASSVVVCVIITRRITEEAQRNKEVKLQYFF